MTFCPCGAGRRVFARAFLAAYGEPRQACAALARLADTDPSRAALTRIEQHLAVRAQAPRPPH